MQIAKTATMHYVRHLMLNHVPSGISNSNTPGIGVCCKGCLNRVASNERKNEYDFSKQRVMIIGDVHGCATEVKEIVEKYGKEDDVVIFVGDLV